MITINPDIYYPLDEILYLEGRAVPNSTVQIQFQKQGAKPITVVAKSDPNGEWVFADRMPFEAGNWEVRARIVDGESVSSWSNPRVVKAIVTGIVIGGIHIKFAILIFIIFILLFLGIAGFWYFARKTKRIQADFQKTLREKEKEETVTFVEQNFAELHQSIAKELEHIERRLQDGELTDEEKEHREHLLRELKEVEASIEKRIKNIQ